MKKRMLIGILILLSFNVFSQNIEVQWGQKKYVLTNIEEGKSLLSKIKRKVSYNKPQIATFSIQPKCNFAKAFIPREFGLPDDYYRSLEDYFGILNEPLIIETKYDYYDSYVRLKNFNGGGKEAVKQSVKNYYAGDGLISDSELRNQERINEKAGHGPISDEKKRAQIHKNEESGFGSYSDKQLKVIQEEERQKQEEYAKLQKFKEQNTEIINEKISAMASFKQNEQYCYVLGVSYEVMVLEKEHNITNDGHKSYSELKDAIISGKPGIGDYDFFSLHDKWKVLLIDAEKYGTEYGIYKFSFTPLKQKSLDYKTRTATYETTINYEYSDRYKNVIEVIKKGYEKAYKEDWTDLPNPEDWPVNYSVSGNETKNIINNGIAYYRTTVENYTDDEILGARLSVLGGGEGLKHHKGVYNAFACVKGGGGIMKDNNSNNFWINTILYDLKIRIVDNDGKELIKPIRYLPKYNIGRYQGGGYGGYIKTENDIIFENIPANVMNLIEDGNAKLDLMAVYLEYGTYKAADDDIAKTGNHRSYIKKFPELEIKKDYIEWECK